MLAPSFVVDFSYPEILSILKKLGFDKIVELTFGAKMINREYYRILKDSKELKISSVCPVVVDFIQKNFPDYKKNLVLVDSPMISTAKICKKFYPKHKTVFISPCSFKKDEARQSNYVDFVLDYNELRNLIYPFKIKDSKSKIQFDKFYNDYTKIYPITGALSKTAHLKKILKKKEIKVLEGVVALRDFLKKPVKRFRFLDVTSCKGGCIGGPCIQNKSPLFMRKRKVINYLKRSLKEDIPDTKKGVISKAESISFVKKEEIF